MEIRNASIRFGEHSGTGPRQRTEDVTFPRPVTKATAILTGFDARFVSVDHHLGNLDVRLETAISGATVRVTATFGLRDWSGDWDDRYAGRVLFSVIAE